MSMDFKGSGKRLTDRDLVELGNQLNAGEDEVHAFLEVESLGRGFDSKGRLKMLFEPHKFYERVPLEMRDQAVQRGLAYKRWGEQKYPSDSYGRLIQAMNLDKKAALESCSWGIAQIMGFNFREAGYRSAEEMVEDFKLGERQQMDAAVRFIHANHLDDELRNHEWSSFARGYNGPGYRKNKYHVKLKKAYEKWAKIPDTILNEDDYFEFEEVPVSHQGNAKQTETFLSEDTSVLQIGSKGPSVGRLQEQLNALNYHVGPVDEKFGSYTDAQVRKFQLDTGYLKVDGKVGKETIKALLSASPAPLIDLDPESFVKTSTIAGNSARQAVTTDITAIGASVGVATTQIQEVKALAAEAASFQELAISMLGQYWWVILIAVFLWYNRGAAKKIFAARAKDEVTGKTRGLRA